MSKVQSTDGVEIYYEVEGSGPPLVLISGGYGTSSDWRVIGYVESLREERTVVLHDPRGHGDSDKPTDPSRYTWRQRAADVIAIVDALAFEQVDVFGYSQGGSVTLALLSGHADRLRSAVGGGASPPPPGFVGPYQPSLDEARGLQERGLEALAAQLDGLWPSVQGDETATAWLETYRARALEGNPLAYIAELEGLSSLDGLHPPDSGPPTLLYAGSANALAAALSRQAAERLAYVTYRELPALDHLQACLRIDLVLPMLREFWGNLG